MKFSDNGINTLKKLEGFRPTMYLDSAGKPTIGYGTLITPDLSWLETANVTDVVATELLKKATAKSEANVNSLVKVPISQDKFDSLVIFSYNVGDGAFRDSTLLKKVNSKAPDTDITAEFMKWIHAGGKVVDGLVARREAEVDLFLSKKKS